MSLRGRNLRAAEVRGCFKIRLGDRYCYFGTVSVPQAEGVALRGLPHVCPRCASLFVMGRALQQIDMDDMGVVEQGRVAVPRQCR